jgi:hypothetical protein
LFECLRGDGFGMQVFHGVGMIRVVDGMAFICDG